MLANLVMVLFLAVATSLKWGIWLPFMNDGERLAFSDSPEPGVDVACGVPAGVGVAEFGVFRSFWSLSAVLAHEFSRGKRSNLSYSVKFYLRLPFAQK